MASPDWDAIGAAIAARYLPANLTAPAGLPTLGPIRTATQDLPSRKPVCPAVLVFPDRGTLEPGNGTRIGEARFLARFYLKPTVDLNRELNACRRWLVKLVDAHGTALQLGGLVVAVRTVDWRIGLLDYAGTDHTGVELGLQVVTSDGWLPTA